MLLRHAAQNTKRGHRTRAVHDGRRAWIMIDGVRIT